ncbi:hypothetical protein bsdtb5_18700 [Anaeromicropila herbilytica]|uniref:Uncharacterized protein n=1 Tax=Anaeromicropila herbilytica TaxID=2785025 RepID=A0A7R7EKW2_9FIRM|nr:hypothetical protein bsdtb5_18700 [Anaeromicropila herbilytica]
MFINNTRDINKITYLECIILFITQRINSKSKVPLRRKEVE